MSSTFGDKLKLSIFGQSHGKAIGMTLDGIPAGLPVDLDALQDFLNRRAPGKNAWSTTRKEEDRPEFLSGILEGRTCGAPICAVIYNQNTRSGDYRAIADCPRPGHADFPAQVKYGGFQDVAGGGHFSGRLTAPLCVAGGLCKQWLRILGIEIHAHIAVLAGIGGGSFDPVAPEVEKIGKDFPVLDPQAGETMRDAIEAARAQGDSVGGIIECAVTGLPVGLGEPMFGGMENRIASAVFAVPAVKGVDFGAGFAAAYLKGSENNDPYTVENGRIRPMTNRAGGILGGLTTGMPLIFQAAIKPTPSISKKQQSVSFSQNTIQTLEIKGRHDPCIVPRAVPVIEAAAALAVMDICLQEGKLWN